MAKITFTDLSAAFASTAALNLKFQQIEDEFANKILYRDEVGAMAVDLDMGGKNLINVNNITQTGTPSIDASDVVVTPVGDVASTDAQAAIQELDAEKAKLAGDATQAFDTAALGVTGNITVSGTVDGRDVAADGTKLDGVEALADVTDTTNVDAAGAVMHTDVAETDGKIIKTASETYEAIKIARAQTGAPSSVNDSSQGYGVGSDWYDETNDDYYVCLDASVGAAQWVQAGTSTPGGVTSVAGIAPIVIGGTASVPSVSVNPATTSTAGSMSAADKTFLDSISSTTANAADLDYLDSLNATGVTSTEYDYLDGVTSSIQTQLDRTKFRETFSSSVNTSAVTSSTIPSWANKIEVSYHMRSNPVSGTGPIYLGINNGSTWTHTGVNTTISAVNSNSFTPYSSYDQGARYIRISTANSVNTRLSGRIVLTKTAGNVWIVDGILSLYLNTTTAYGTSMTAGYISLASISQVRLENPTGVNSIDDYELVITYEE